eukprot:CAMPEP_0113452188 /NCGR_PEP_ID=MMETSP0014_2-20120614/6720_1 /TAXON_ID=2857 /ORGANISM="Nitzschia sp." /LENGTH=1063 /DNA_ID=CAMNT_0000343557 /DNA_START=175 /DNA_END=3362 /DNA_ORIENTATION=- /assembly_acc=CAM_ASM_000159
MSSSSSDCRNYTAAAATAIATATEVVVADHETNQRRRQELLPSQQDGHEERNPQQRRTNTQTPRRRRKRPRRDSVQFLSLGSDDPFLVVLVVVFVTIFVVTVTISPTARSSSSGFTVLGYSLSPSSSSSSSQSRLDKLSLEKDTAVVKNNEGSDRVVVMDAPPTGKSTNENNGFFFDPSQHHSNGVANGDVVDSSVNGRNGYQTPTVNELDLNGKSSEVTFLFNDDGHDRQDVTRRTRGRQDTIEFQRPSPQQKNRNGTSDFNNLQENDGTMKTAPRDIINSDAGSSVVNGERSASETGTADELIELGVCQVAPWYQRPFKWISGGGKENSSNEDLVSGTNSSISSTSKSEESDVATFTGDDDDGQEEEEKFTSLRRLWRRRHARTLEEGIRRERSRAVELSQILDKAQIDARQGQERTYVERTLMGLLNALAEEIEDLDIDFSTVPKTPLWRKEVEEVRINFSRLGFRPLRMGGVNAKVRAVDLDETTNTTVVSDVESSFNAQSVSDKSLAAAISQEKDDALNQTAVELSLVESADEAFDRIDEDNSGTLDRDEIAQALSSISALETDRESIEELATNLVELYDLNGDGVVDREEYQKMVEDMAKVRPAQDEDQTEPNEMNPFNVVKDSIQSVSEGISKKAVEVASAARERIMKADPESTGEEEIEMGSIVLSDLTLDLRRLVFGAVPVVKTVAPGGPLILEPFTATITASFSREDVMGSFLLDAGLRRLVARALRVRVRAFRDGVDGALFFGRRWKMTSETAPVVDVLGLSNVEFDSRDRMIITGRARIRTSPDAPTVTQTFKLRAKIGTRKNGQVIRLVEPELAFVFECPKALESGLAVVCETFGLAPPERPEPYYSFFPIYSPFKVSDNDGFDMGEDNSLRSIYIRNGKLRFEMSAVLRPGRFLGSHYLAFTVPQRTFILTMDRVFEGVRAARENKKIAARAKKLREKEIAAGLLVASAEDDVDGTSHQHNSSVLEKTPSAESSPQISKQPEVEPESPSSRLFRTIRNNKPKPKSFFARFVEGYTLLEREGEANNDRLTNEISYWFGRQSQGQRSNTTA